MSSGRAFHKVGALCENALYSYVLRLHLGTIKSFFLEDLRFLKTRRSILRTVPTFVSAYTFCASHKPWFKRSRAGVDIEGINYTTKYMTKIKEKFSYVDQINCNEPVLKQEHQTGSISLTTNCLRLPAGNLAVIFRKLH